MIQPSNPLAALQNGEAALFDGTVDTKIRLSHWWYHAMNSSTNITVHGARDWLSCLQGIHRIINPLLNEESQKELEKVYVNSIAVPEYHNEDEFVFMLNRPRLDAFEQKLWKFQNKMGLGVAVKEDHGLQT